MLEWITPSHRRVQTACAANAIFSLHCLSLFRCAQHSGRFIITCVNSLWSGFYETLEDSQSVPPCYTQTLSNWHDWIECKDCYQSSTNCYHKSSSLPQTNFEYVSFSHGWRTQTWMSKSSLLMSWRFMHKYLIQKQVLSLQYIIYVYQSRYKLWYSPSYERMMLLSIVSKYLLQNLQTDRRTPRVFDVTMLFICCYQYVLMLQAISRLNKKGITGTALVHVCRIWKCNLREAGKVSKSVTW